MYDAILELAHALWKNGLSVSALGTAVFVALKQPSIKRLMRYIVPWLLQKDREARQQMQNQMALLENQRRIMAALGVEPVWPQDVPISKMYKSYLAACKMSSTFFSAARSRARAAAARERQYITSYLISKRRNKNMKKWIRPDSLTAIVGVIVAAVAQYTGLQIDPTNILGAAILLAGYFKAQELVTVVRDANGLPTGFQFNSRKLIFTAVAFALVVADVAFKLNLSNELILSVAAAVTGYNVIEAKKDAEQAKQEGADARQAH